MAFCGKGQKSQNLKIIRTKINIIQIISAEFIIEDDPKLNKPKQIVVKLLQLCVLEKIKS